VDVDRGGGIGDRGRRRRLGSQRGQQAGEGFGLLFGQPVVGGDSREAAAGGPGQPGGGGEPLDRFS